AAVAGRNRARVTFDVVAASPVAVGKPVEPSRRARPPLGDARVGGREPVLLRAVRPRRACLASARLLLPAGPLLVPLDPVHPFRRAHRLALSAGPGVLARDARGASGGAPRPGVGPPHALGLGAGASAPDPGTRSDRVGPPAARPANESGGPPAR